ncbi:MAG: hypothetical protein ACRCUT_00395, partial [Spirochaetota bacterium]
KVRHHQYKGLLLHPHPLQMPAQSIKINSAGSIAAAAAAVFGFVLFEAGIPVSALSAAIGGAFLLFIFTEIENAVSTGRSGFVVSGESSVIAAECIFLYASAGCSGAAVWIIACAVFCSCDVFFISIKRTENRDIFFTGIMAHLICAVAALFLISRGALAGNQILSAFSGGFFPVSHPLPAAAVPLAWGISIFVMLKMMKRFIAPVSSEKSPLRYKGSLFLFFTARAVTIFFAFVLSGVFLLPFDLRSRRFPVSSRILTLSLYIILSLAGAAAVSRGYALPAVCIFAASSYILYAAHTLRRKDHARDQRTFIRTQRNTRS